MSIKHILIAKTFPVKFLGLDTAGNTFPVKFLEPDTAGNSFT